eukprot:2035923-Rhodomonas_salina.1
MNLDRLVKEFGGGVAAPAVLRPDGEATTVKVGLNSGTILPTPSPVGPLLPVSSALALLGPTPYSLGPRPYTLGPRP